MIVFKTSPRAKILFVGINPHPGSERRSVPFSNNKMFWYLLNRAGLLDEVESDLKDDATLKRIYDEKFISEYSLNFVNLVDRPTVNVAKLKRGAVKLKMSISQHQACNHVFPQMQTKRLLENRCKSRRGKRLGYTVAWVSLLSLLGSGCQPSGERPLTVGMELDYPPFEMTDAQGRPTGISVDLAHALAAHLQRPVKVRNVSFDGLIPALKTGKIDLIISSMTATPERAQSIDFSEPYVKTGICLLVGKNSPLQTTADIAKPGLTVAVKKGTTGQVYAHEHLPHVKLLVLDKESTCVLEVVQGKADAFVYGQLSIHRDWQRNRDTTRALLTPLRSEYWAVGIRKGNDDLRRQVNEFLHTFRTSGGFDRLSDRYLKTEKIAFEQLGIPFFFVSESEP